MLTPVQASSSRRASKTRLAIDRVRLVYAVLVVTQFVTISLYELGQLRKEVAVTVGLATSLVGPLLSFLVSIHTFRHRRLSKTLDIASVAVSYAVTCTSFAVIYVIISDFYPEAFNQPSGSHSPMSLGAAVYYSVVTITTTGYGDISPMSGFARAAACWEIITGLLYQVFIFSLVASLISTPAPGVEHDRPD